MKQEIEIDIKTKADVRVSVCQWDDGGAWLHLSMRGGTAYAALTKDEAQQLLEGLQTILAKEVTA
jgi:predicted SpoU family rRNA methylase